MTWLGHPEHHYEQATLMMQENGVQFFPWSWIIITCDEPMCLDVEHMLVNSPSKLLYPRGVCVYCGERSTDQDHLLPKSFTDEAIRKRVLTVPSCHECNTILSDKLLWAIDERRKLAQKKLRARHKKELRYQLLTEDDLTEYGPGLRPAMRRASAERMCMEDRLAWPKDPLYDIRYLQKSGIEDPWAFGILATSPYRNSAAA